MFVFGSTPLAQYSDRLPITEEMPAIKYALAISEPTSSEHGVTKCVHQRPFFIFMSTQPVMPPTTQRMTAMAKTTRGHARRTASSKSQRAPDGSGDAELHAHGQIQR